MSVPIGSGSVHHVDQPSGIDSGQWRACAMPRAASRLRGAPTLARNPIGPADPSERQTRYCSMRTARLHPVPQPPRSLVGALDRRRGAREEAIHPRIGISHRFRPLLSRHGVRREEPACAARPLSRNLPTVVHLSHSAKEASTMASNKEQVAELLYQALETEKGGVLVYETALRCVVNDDLKEEWEKYLEQTQTHVQIVEGLFEQFGLDPNTETPGRLVVRHIGESLVRA